MEDIYKAMSYSALRDKMADTAQEAAQDLAEVLPDSAKKFITKHPFLSFFASVAAAVAVSQLMPKNTPNDAKRIARNTTITLLGELRRKSK